jgi:hypothetical protein
VDDRGYNLVKRPILARLLDAVAAVLTLRRRPGRHGTIRTPRPAGRHRRQHSADV